MLTVIPLRASTTCLASATSLSRLTPCSVLTPAWGFADAMATKTNSISVVNISVLRIGFLSTYDDNP